MNYIHVIDIARALRDSHHQYRALLENDFWILSNPYFSQARAQGDTLVICEAEGIQLITLGDDDYLGINVCFNWHFPEIQGDKWRELDLGDLDWTQEPDVYRCHLSKTCFLKNKIDLEIFCSHGGGLIIKKEHFNPSYNLA